MSLKHDGVPVVFEVRLVTEPGKCWQGIRSIAVCKTIEEVTKVIQEIEVPIYWMIDIQLQDDLEDPEYYEL